jgi:hypothetical protein
MLLGYRLPHTLDQRVNVWPVNVYRGVALKFLHNDQTLFAFHLYGEGHATSTSQICMTFRHRLLNILRVEIAAADNDQIFKAPGNEQLTVVQEPEVSGAKERFA